MKRKYSSEGKIYLIACPFLINYSIIALITGGSKFSWARVGPIQYVVLNGIIVIFLVGSFIYYMYSYRNCIKNIKIYNIILFFLLWGLSFFIHAKFQEISLMLVLAYFSCAVVEFLIIKDFEIE